MTTSVFVALALSCGGSQSPPLPLPIVTAETSPELTISKAQPPRVFVNDTGVILTMVYLKTPEGQYPTALVYFVGYDHPLAAKVFIVENRSGSGDQIGNRIVWRTNYNGRPLEVVAFDHKTLKMYFALAGTHRPRMVVSFDSQRTAEIQTSEVIAAYTRDKEKVEKLARVDLQYHQSVIQRKMERPIQQVHEACGRALPA